MSVLNSSLSCLVCSPAVWLPSPVLGSLTMMLARRKLSPVPTLFSIWLMLVAVTLSWAGNHAAETAGGADVTTMLGTPLRMAPR